MSIFFIELCIITGGCLLTAAYGYIADKFEHVEEQ